MAAPATPAPATASALDDIGRAIGDALFDEEPAPGTPAAGTAPLAAPAAGAAAPPVPAAPAAPAGPKWPATIWETEACASVLGSAVGIGLVAEEPGAPSGELVNDFCHTLTPLENRLFGAEPPEDLPAPELARRGVVTRLRLFAAQREGEKLLKQSGQPLAVDAGAMAAFGALVDADLAAIRKEIEACVAAARPDRVRELNLLSTTLTKALQDLKAFGERAAGGADRGPTHAVLLDEDVAVPGQAPAHRREPGKEPAKAEVKPELRAVRQRRELTPQERLRRRIIVWSVLAVSLGVAAFFVQPPRPEQVPIEAFASVPGVVDVTVNEGKARVGVSAAWTGSREDVARLCRILQAHRVKSLVVVDGAGSVRAAGRTDSRPVVFAK